ncbi:ALDH-like protein [Gymnopus androsaceus JB14]|uniref:ALDH-like protein n=1 Tax=Gymnopus androsaceus JB14 TaxID=1447944 RepID=A0A6A4I9Z2_9AGAR|nr:ALDH-like protein [Gymnopus androsaceus JB14]
MAPFTPLFTSRWKTTPFQRWTLLRNSESALYQIVGLSASASSEDLPECDPRCRKRLSKSGSTLAGTASELVKSDKYKEMILDAVVEETAASPAMAMLNWIASMGTLHDTAMLLNDLEGMTFPLKARHSIIVPWNLPLPLAMRAALIPILCGNTVVFRSSEICPRSHGNLFGLFQEVGLPAGIFNLLSTSRETVPQLTAEIIAHPLIRKIIVGRAIVVEAAKQFKPCVLDGERLLLFLRGQICNIARTMKAGNTQADTAAVLGPVISESPTENIITMIQEAKDAVLVPADGVDEAIDRSVDMNLYLAKGVSSRIHSEYVRIGGTLNGEITHGFIGLGTLFDDMSKEVKAWGITSPEKTKPITLTRRALDDENVAIDIKYSRNLFTVRHEWGPAIPSSHRTRNYWLCREERYKIQGWRPRRSGMLGGYRGGSRVKILTDE